MRLGVLGCMVGLWLLSIKAEAQSYKKAADLEVYRHHLSYADYQVSFFTLPTDIKMAKAKLGHDYYWLAGRQINVTSGGYSGKLLHGNFSSYYLNKQLKEQGEFKKGLKIGEWKQWSESGSLQGRINYSKGQKNGTFYRYNEKGILIEQGNYLNDKLDGKLKKYQGKDSVTVMRYRDGVVHQKSSRPWWKFWNKRK